MPTIDQEHALQVTGYWIAYFAARIHAVIHDDALSWPDQRQWLDEVVEDLQDLAQKGCAVTDDNVNRAQRLARAMQAFIFHEGPNPDCDADFVVDTQPIPVNGTPIPHETSALQGTCKSETQVPATPSSSGHETQVILIPYTEQEGDTAEVWIGRYEKTAYAHVDIPLLALADFAGRDMRDPKGIQEHCDAWHADRILVSTDETPPRWTAYTIASVLLGKPVEV